MQRETRWGLPLFEPDFSDEARKLEALIQTREIGRDHSRSPLGAVKIVQDNTTYSGSALEYYRFQTGAEVQLPPWAEYGQFLAAGIVSSWNLAITGNSFGRQDLRFVATWTPREQFRVDAPRINSEDPWPVPSNNVVTISLNAQRERSEPRYDLLAFSSDHAWQSPSERLATPLLYVEELLGLTELPSSLQRVIRQLLSRGLVQGFEWSPELFLPQGKRIENPVKSDGSYHPQRKQYDLFPQLSSQREALGRAVGMICSGLEQNPIHWAYVQNGLEHIHNLYPSLLMTREAPGFTSQHLRPDLMMQWLAEILHLGMSSLIAASQEEMLPPTLHEFPPEWRTALATVTQALLWLDVTEEELFVWKSEAYPR